MQVAYKFYFNSVIWIKTRIYLLPVENKFIELIIKQIKMKL